MPNRKSKLSLTNEDRMDSDEEGKCLPGQNDRLEFEDRDKLKARIFKDTKYLLDASEKSDLSQLEFPPDFLEKLTRRFAKYYQCDEDNVKFVHKDKKILT